MDSRLRHKEHYLEGDAEIVAQDVVHYIGTALVIIVEIPDDMLLTLSLKCHTLYSRHR
jgi:hypothetical protein